MRYSAIPLLLGGGIERIQGGESMDRSICPFNDALGKFLFDRAYNKIRPDEQGNFPKKDTGLYGRSDRANGEVATIDGFVEMLQSSLFNISGLNIPIGAEQNPANIFPQAQLVQDSMRNVIEGWLFSEIQPIEPEQGYPYLLGINDWPEKSIVEGSERRGFFIARNTEEGRILYELKVNRDNQLDIYAQETDINIKQQGLFRGGQRSTVYETVDVSDDPALRLSLLSLLVAGTPGEAIALVKTRRKLGTEEGEEVEWITGSLQGTEYYPLLETNEVFRKEVFDSLQTSFRGKDAFTFDEVIQACKSVERSLYMQSVFRKVEWLATKSRHLRNLSNEEQLQYEIGLRDKASNYIDDLDTIKRQSGDFLIQSLGERFWDATMSFKIRKGVINNKKPVEIRVQFDEDSRTFSIIDTSRQEGFQELSGSEEEFFLAKIMECLEEVSVEKGGFFSIVPVYARENLNPEEVIIRNDTDINRTPSAVMIPLIENGRLCIDSYREDGHRALIIKDCVIDLGISTSTTAAKIADVVYGRRYLDADPDFPILDRVLKLSSPTSVRRESQISLSEHNFFPNWLKYLNQNYQLLVTGAENAAMQGVVNGMLLGADFPKNLITPAMELWRASGNGKIPVEEQDSDALVHLAGFTLSGNKLMFILNYRFSDGFQTSHPWQQLLVEVTRDGLVSDYKDEKIVITGSADTETVFNKSLFIELVLESLRQISEEGVGAHIDLSELSRLIGENSRKYEDKN